MDQNSGYGSKFNALGSTTLDARVQALAMGTAEGKTVKGEKRQEVVGAKEDSREVVGVLSDDGKSSSDGLWWTVFGSILLVTFWTRLHKVRTTQDLTLSLILEILVVLARFFNY